MKVITIDADRFFRHQKGKSNQSWSKRVTFSFRFVSFLLSSETKLLSCFYHWKFIRKIAWISKTWTEPS